MSEEAVDEVVDYLRSAECQLKELCRGGRPLLFLATLTGQKALFSTAAKHELPVFGYQRTK